MFFLLPQNTCIHSRASLSFHELYGGSRGIPACEAGWGREGRVGRVVCVHGRLLGPSEPRTALSVNVASPPPVACLRLLRLCWCPGTLKTWRTRWAALTKRRAGS